MIFYLDPNLKQYFDLTEVTAQPVSYFVILRAFFARRIFMRDSSAQKTCLRMTTNDVLSTQLLFHQLMRLSGEVFRHQKDRITQRIQLGNETYFIKQHHGVGWKEIFKNVCMLKWPVCSARNEWQAIEKLKKNNIPVPEVVGFGVKGVNPATLKSFILMRELKPIISLEDLGKVWQTNPPAFSEKLSIIKEIARMVKTMHTLGMNHRDCYLCHFLLDLTAKSQGEIKLYLIDLHRAEIRHHTPVRWVMKDLSGLYFSSLGFNFTAHDYLRFIKYYRGDTLRHILHEESFFWNKVKTRGKQLYNKHGG